MEKLIATFTATSDDGSVEFTIQCFAQEITSRTREGTQTALGRKKLLTTEGLSVNRVDKGVYEIVQLGLRVTSDDPDAV